MKDTKYILSPCSLFHRPLQEKQANLYVFGEHLKQETEKRETKLKRCTHAFKQDQRLYTGCNLSHFRLKTTKMPPSLRLSQVQIQNVKHCPNRPCCLSHFRNLLVLLTRITRHFKHYMTSYNTTLSFYKTQTLQL